jgi:Transcriptional regulator
MDTRAIEYVIAIAEEGSYTRAAERLFISQPALSQYIKKLESNLNIQIFQKSGQALTLFPAGKILLRDGRRILEMQEQMLSKIADLSKSRMEVIRFGISPFYSKYYLPGVLPQFQKLYPNIKLEISEEISVNLEKCTLDGDLDFCLVPKFPKNPLLVYKTVCMEEIYIAIPPDSPINAYATASTGAPYMALKHLTDEPFIMLKSQQKFTAMCRDILNRAGITPNIVYETLNWDTVNIMAASGIGIGFVPEVLVRSPVADKRPKYYRIADMDIKRDYAVAYQKNRYPSYPAARLIELFISTLSGEGK